MYQRDNKYPAKDAIIDYLLEKAFEDLETINNMLTNNQKEDEDGARKLIMNGFTLEELYTHLNRACDRIQEAQDVNAEEDLELPSCMKISRTR